MDVKKRLEDPSERSPSINLQRAKRGGTFIGQGSCQPKLQHRCSNRAQESKQFLIFRDVGLVYVREHRSNVRTIEQILFKYSRARYAVINRLYTQKWRHCKTYGIKKGSPFGSCFYRNETGSHNVSIETVW